MREASAASEKFYLRPAGGPPHVWRQLGQALAVSLVASLAVVALTLLVRGLGATVRQSSPAAPILLAAFLLMAATGACAWVVGVYFRATDWPELRPNRVSLNPLHKEAFVETEPDRLDEEEEPEIPAGLVQRITRTQENVGEAIHVLATAVIPAGDRQAVVHVAFCPPLAAMPALTAHALDADDAEVKIAQAETFGTRIEVRLAGASATERHVVVELFGTTTARSS